MFSFQIFVYVYTIPLCSDASDFCLWAPRTVLLYFFKVCPSSQISAATPGNIGDTERYEVAYCSKLGRGARTFPDGTLQGVHFVKTPEYVQVTGVGDFTKINVPKGDAGGELDNRGADGMLQFSPV
jgi:hypothetical protein